MKVVKKVAPKIQRRIKCQSFGRGDGRFSEGVAAYEVNTL